MDGIDRYFGLIAASVLSGIVITVMVGFEPARSFFCSKDETACSREWISALSGWAAFVAAIFTVVYLRRQLADVAKHHREITEIQLMPVTAIVRQTRNRIFHYEAHVMQLKRVCTGVASGEEPAGSATYYRAVFEIEYKSLREILEDETIINFERHVGSGAPLTLKKSAIDRLEKAAHILKSAQANSPHNVDRMMAMGRFEMDLEWAVDEAESYLKAVASAANSYLDKWNILYTPPEGGYIGGKV